MKSIFFCEELDKRFCFKEGHFKEKTRQLDGSSDALLLEQINAKKMYTAYVLVNETGKG